MGHEIVDGYYAIDGINYVPDVYDKYLVDIRQGINELLTGQVRGFRGYPAEIYRGISMHLFLTESSLDAVRESVSSPIRQAAETSGVSIYDTSLWTPHITVTDLRAPPYQTVADAHEMLDRDPRVAEILEAFAGQHFRMETLVPGSAITLRAAVIPPLLTEARIALGETAQRSGMTEKDFRNIAHITQARLAPVDSSSRPDYMEFLKRLLEIRHTLIRRPVELVIDHAEMLPNTKYINRHEARLMQQIRSHS